MDGDTAKLPAHVTVYAGLRQMILCGDLVPGQPVTIQGLVALLGAGMTPVREAIRRLTAEGALHFQGNRRVSVPKLGAAELDELLFARLALEPQLAGWAAARLDAQGIDRLAAIDEALNQAIARGDVQQYMAQNHRFHMQLYAAADKRIVLPMVEALWLRSAPSLRVMCHRFGTRNLPDMHRAALAALRAGDTGAVAAAIAADIRQGIENVRLALEEEPAGPDHRA